MRFLLTGLFVALLAGAVSRAEARCGEAPDYLLCEDFDNYCLGAPEFPARCTYGQAIDNAAFYARWPYGACGDPMRIQDDVKTGTTISLYADTPPYTARYLQGDQTHGAHFFSRHTRDLVPEIAARDPAGNAVFGTAERPMVLDYHYHFHDTGTQFYNNSYLELSLNDDRAPTDYIRSDSCHERTLAGDACGHSGPLPIICQQNNPLAQAAGCPPPSATVHAGIAVGLLAYLDVNPCHCDESVAHAAQNWHLVFFDGLKWWTLKANVPTAGGGTLTALDGGPTPPPQEFKIHSPGDFGLSNKDNHVRLTITATDVLVELDYVERSAVAPYYKYLVTHWQRIPRRYLGGFNRISMGAGQGCELDPATGQCREPVDYRCLWPNTQSGNLEYDSILLSGGLTGRTEGACCTSTSGCQSRTAQECRQQGGSYAGDGTTCGDASARCCHDPAMDHDGDRDVDMTDFARLQRCLTAEEAGVGEHCQCFDYDRDLVIGEADLEKFVQCAGGPGVAADVDCDN